MRSSKYAHRKEDWIEKYNAGMSFRAIAAEEGLYQNTVQNVIIDSVVKRDKSPYDKYGEKWVELYVNEGYLISEIAARYKTGYSVVHRVLSKHGVAPEPKENTQKRKYTHLADTWADQYKAGMSLQEIARTCGANHQTVLNYVREKGVQIREYSETSRQYDLDETYFKEIDTPEKAFWVGVFFARGSILTHVCSKSIQLTLRDSKRPLLEAFCKAVNTNKPYTKRLNEDMWELRLHSQSLHNQLEEIGLTTRKKSSQIFPEQLPESLHLDILRGYISAKGYYNHSTFILSGTHSFLMTAKTLLGEQVGIQSIVREVKSEDAVLHDLNITYKETPKFKAWLNINLD